eukprot:s3879_g10.t1
MAPDRRVKRRRVTPASTPASSCPSADMPPPPPPSSVASHHPPDSSNPSAPVSESASGPILPVPEPPPPNPPADPAIPSDSDDSNLSTRPPSPAPMERFSAPIFVGPSPPISDLFRNWAPVDDNELITYKKDTKARPSWKTIGQRLHKVLKVAVPDGCGSNLPAKTAPTYVYANQVDTYTFDHLLSGIAERIEKQWQISVSPDDLEIRYDENQGIEVFQVTSDQPYWNLRNLLDQYRVTRDLMVAETNLETGRLREHQVEFFFFKLVGDWPTAQRMGNYWRQHYGLETFPSDAVPDPTPAAPAASGTEVLDPATV